jgi:RNA polymerase sigma-70 factor, ECF subfamily
VADYPRLVAALAVTSGSRALAEDAVQEALVRAWERSDRGEGIDSLSAWVARVALNLSRSTFRRMRAERRARARFPIPQNVAAAGEGLDLIRALEALPRRQREVTVLRYLLEFRVEEIAGILGVHEGTVKTSLHRARRSLAEALGASDPEEVDERAGP